MCKYNRRAAVALLVLALILAGLGYWGYRQQTASNPANCHTIGDIAVPRGFVRDSVVPGSEGEFLRALPLRPCGAKVKYYDGRVARNQWISAAVVDLSLLSNAEQCADITIRLRTEWLFKEGRYGDIAFHNVNGKRLRYHGGPQRFALNAYLRHAYQWCSTFSVLHETQPRPLAEIRPGDVFVYAARSRMQLGHAILVADVATNPRTGQKAILCVEGNTPARSCHVMRNNLRLTHSEWFIFDGDEKTFRFSTCHFKRDELRHY